VLDKGSLARAVRASAAIPGVFPPVQHQGKILVDGGVVDNIPISVAKAKGADPGAMKNGQPKNSQPKPSWAADSKFGAGLMAADLSPAELQAMGINLKDWARLPGHLKDEVLQAAEENVPEEYRQLVKHYFQEIARRGGGTDKK